MKYKIIKQWERVFYTTANEPRAVSMIKFETDSGYVDTVEIPVNLLSEQWIRKAVLKRIENAKRVCGAAKEVKK